jgi:hypothetical protein
MITRSSAFLDPKTSAGQLIDDRRSRVLLLLCQYRYSIEDLAMALNCAEAMVRSLLARPYRALYVGDHDNPERAMEPINLRMIPQIERPVVLNPPTASKDEIARQQEKHAQQLAIEVRRWLCTFETSDQDRRQAIEQAGFLLDESPLDANGRYHFEVNQVFMELLGVWRPYRTNPEDRELGKAVIPWFASWIRFWISDPKVWNRALDLEFAYFDARARAA